MTKTEPKTLRIYHGPVNIGGIGRYLADWQRKRGALADFITYASHPRKPIHHLNLELDKLRRGRRLAVMLSFLIFCLARYDIFHFYFGCSLLPWNLDLPILRIFGKKIIMQYCGSDIRLVEVEEKRNPYSYLIRFESDHPKHDRRKKKMMWWQNLWVHRVIAVRNRYADAATVIPEHKIIKDIWIHNMMDLRAYQPSNFGTKQIPLVVHAPTNEEIKGTVYIERAMNALKNEGHQFEYRRLTGLLHEEVMRIYRDEADIIVDAVIMGGFGSLAVEGMYFGKPVCGYLVESVRREMYPDCPIYVVTIDNLKERLGWLISHPEERMRLGKEGRAFVERHFDREKLNQRLWSIYQTLGLIRAQE